MCHGHPFARDHLADHVRGKLCHLLFQSHVHV